MKNILKTLDRAAGIVHAATTVSTGLTLHVIGGVARAASAATDDERKRDIADCVSKAAHAYGTTFDIAAGYHARHGLVGVLFNREVTKHIYRELGTAVSALMPGGRAIQDEIIADVCRDIDANGTPAEVMLKEVRKVAIDKLVDVLGAPAAFSGLH